MDDYEIKKIFSSFIPQEKIIIIEDKSRGAAQIVKKIKTSKFCYIIKIPKKTICIDRQIFAYQKLSKKIRMPKLIFYNNKLLIEEYISGIDLDRMHLNKKINYNIYYNLGKILKKIHQTKTHGFGSVNKDNKGNYKSLKKAFFYYFQKYNKKLSLLAKQTPFSSENLYLLIKKNLFYLANYKLISKSTQKKIYQYIKKNNSFINTKESFLLHFDLVDWNIKIKNNKIAAILDFANLSCGPKSLDFVKQYIFNFGDKKFEYILKGYGDEINLDEIKYFSVLHLIRKLPYYHYRIINKNNIYFTMEDIKKYSKTLKNIIN